MKVETDIKTCELCSQPSIHSMNGHSLCQNHYLEMLRERLKREVDIQAADDMFEENRKKRFC